MTTGPAARLLGIGEAMTRLLADSGVLPCRRIDKLRIYTRENVLKLRARRMGEPDV